MLFGKLFYEVTKMLSIFSKRSRSVGIIVQAVKQTFEYFLFSKDPTCHHVYTAKVGDHTTI